MRRSLSLRPSLKLWRRPLIAGKVTRTCPMIFILSLQSLKYDAFVKCLTEVSLVKHSPFSHFPVWKSSPYYSQWATWHELTVVSYVGFNSNGLRSDLPFRKDSSSYLCPPRGSAEHAVSIPMYSGSSGHTKLRRPEMERDPGCATAAPCLPQTTVYSLGFWFWNKRWPHITKA